MTYDDIALKIVPVGERPTVGELREDIAKALRQTTETALAKQREQQFPELGELRQGIVKERERAEQELADMKKKQKVKQEELNQQEQELRQRIKAMENKEKSLDQYTKALESYMAWLDGAGEVDESGKRFDALRAAYHNYKGAKK